MGNSLEGPVRAKKQFHEIQQKSLAPSSFELRWSCAPGQKNHRKWCFKASTVGLPSCFHNSSQMSPRNSSGTGKVHFCFQACDWPDGNLTNKNLHPWRLTWNITWRFGSDHVPFYSWVICRFQPFIFQGVLNEVGVPGDSICDLFLGWWSHLTLLRGWVKWPPTRRSKVHESNDLVFTSTLVHLPILDFYSPWRWMTGAFTYIRDIFSYINGWFVMVNFGDSSPQFSDSDHQEYCIFSRESQIRMNFCRYYWVGG